jgi:hypothetical protein
MATSTGPSSGSGCVAIDSLPQWFHASSEPRAAADAYSVPRRVFVDEHLSFSPWHGLLAHQPLGNINRARRLAYRVSASFRRAQEGRAETEPITIDELPE